MGDYTNRRVYDANGPRIPRFTERFRSMVDGFGGITKLHDATGISRPTIQFWYNGQRTPDAEHLIMLSKVFGVSSDWLLGITCVGNYTDDQELKIVSEYIGLSNAAVRELHEMAHR